MADFAGQDFMRDYGDVGAMGGMAGTHLGNGMNGNAGGTAAQYASANATSMGGPGGTSRSYGANGQGQYTAAEGVFPRFDQNQRRM